MKRVTKIILSATVLSIVLAACGGEAEGEDQVQNTDFTYDYADRYELKSINRPFKEEKIPLDTLSFPAEMDTQVVLPSGSYISVPQNAFLDAEGKLVEGMVDLTYREFNDPASFFASGIPMALSGNENEFEVFESAGMFEIMATQNGEMLQPNPDNPIEVGIASKNEEDIPMWKFEEDEGWKEADDPKLIDEEDMDSTVNMVIPDPPKKVVSATYDITSNLVSQKPHLKPYENWSFIPTDPECEDQMVTYCKNVEVEKAGGGKYNITITKWTNQKVTCECKRYKGQSGYLKAYQAYIDEWGEYMKFQSIIAKVQNRFEETGNRVLRAFTPPSFGIFNCDRVYKVSANKYTYEYKDYNIDDVKLYCIDYTENSKYPCVIGTRIGINPDHKFAVMGVTKGEQVLYSNISDCAKSEKDNHFTFDLKELDQSVPMEELMTLLQE